ncbi:MAG: PstS family phosphate ABC transporter substrate-binding protein [Planctomycetes bacterium]|nr:PstS family phosphate ABC transporter substrate-binding protein [Planctomycetota bacterium]
MRSPMTAVAAGALLVITCCGSGCTGERVTVAVDGSSTVFPITEAMAEEFGAAHPGVQVTVGVSGTGGGFKKFCIGEKDINDASRPIKSSEADKAKDHGIDFIELPVAFDGISVVVHPENDFVDHLTVEELNRIWGPDSKITKWSEVREGWPDRTIKLYGPGTDSGTFDYFTEVINGESQACRPDFTASEDDNVLVRGVAGDKDSLGFFGFAYYEENHDKLKVVPIMTATGPVAPTRDSINDNSYQPLSRPIFIYVNSKSAQRSEVRDFVTFYLKNAPEYVAKVGYVALPSRVYELAMKRFEGGVTGSTFSGKSTAGVPLEEFLK